MDKPNRKLTWVHVTYEADGMITVLWATLHWKDGKYIRKHTRECHISRKFWGRMARLVHLAYESPRLRYIIPAYNGWSVCWEIITRPLLG